MSATSLGRVARTRGEGLASAGPIGIESGREGGQTRNMKMRMSSVSLIRWCSGDRFKGRWDKDMGRPKDGFGVMTWGASGRRARARLRKDKRRERRCDHPQWRSEDQGESISEEDRGDECSDEGRSDVMRDHWAAQRKAQRMGRAGGEAGVLTAAQPNVWRAETYSGDWRGGHPVDGLVWRLATFTGTFREVQ